MLLRTTRGGRGGREGGRGSLFRREWQRKFCTAHLAYYSLLSHARGKGIREIKAPRYDSRCIAFCNFTVTLLAVEGREDFFLLLKLISIRVRYFRSYIYIYIYKCACVHSPSGEKVETREKKRGIRDKRKIHGRG